jgi:hypothetical protein
MRTALAASAIAYGAMAIVILLRIGRRMNESPVGLTNASEPEVAVVS